MEDKEGLNVTFCDLKYSVPVKKKEDKSGSGSGNGNDNGNDNGSLEILHGINGAFISSRMTAIMGPSGSGKSTLLDILAGRKTVGNTTGSIKINGSRPTLDFQKRFMGYVEQNDTLLPELDVHSFLSYTAELKLPATMTSAERNRRVEEVIDKLDLGSCRNTLIGDELNRGISGGQAKRVNIGLAMITRPRIIFLDEPTSGLDSRTANEVVELLRDLAQDGRTIICSIHSPTGHSFSLFDDLYMLHSGRTIYEGTVANAQAYFEGLGHARNANCSLPEWLVDLTSELPSRLEDEDDQDDDEEKKKGNKLEEEEEQPSSFSSKDFAALYDNSESKVAADYRRGSVSSMVRELKAEENDKAPNNMRKLWTLLKYRMVAHCKDPQFLGPRFGDKIIFSLLLLSLYFRTGDKMDPQSIFSTASVLYFVSAICGYGASAFMPSLSLERALYYREINDGCYTPMTYYVAKFVEESVVAIFTSLVFTVTTFFGCSFQGRFDVFFLVYYLTTMVSIVLAYAVAAIIPTMDGANATLPTLITVWMFFGGLILVFDEIPRGWYWFSWTSFLRYSWGAFMLNQFDGQENGRAPVFFASDGSSPLTILEFYGLEGKIMGSVGACLGLLSATIVIGSIIGVLALTYMRHDKR